MKKTFTILFSLFMILGLAACGNSASQAEQSSTSKNTGEKTELAAAQSPKTDTQKAQEAKILVAYFSATNTTERVAERLANGMSADLYEIVPEKPYTEADLNYNDNNSRATIEMNNANARPAISGSVKDMKEYDIVFVGYPIWMGEAPRIVSTFVESYDFSGKIIVPFCTSGSSGIGSSVNQLKQLTSGAQWLEGRRLSGSDSQNTVMQWVSTLGLNLK